MTKPTHKKTGRLRRLLLGASLGAAVVFFVAGIVFWGGFNTAMEATNTLNFCITCHEMRDNVYAEYRPTIHYSNRSGVRATCSDCHVPDPWVHKVVRKIQASGELYHWALGTIDTPEKFDERRLYLAKKVWTAMKQTDSRECRNCHNFESMSPEHQKPRARRQHLNAFETGQTCIDCHKGIAHKPVHDLLSDEELEALEAAEPKYVRVLPAAWKAFRDDGLKSSKKKAPAESVPMKPAEPVRQAAAQPATQPAAPATGAAPATAASATQAEPAQAASEAPAASQPAAAPAATATDASPPAAAAGGGIDWSTVPAREVTLFYPGQSSMEWVLNGRDHGGARAFTKAGDRCFDCHEEELAEIGPKLVSGEDTELEPTPIPGKRGVVPVKVQAAHDGEKLHLRFQWPDTAHSPAPFVDGGKMDPDNPVKLAILLATDDVEYADRAGCWGACHHDLRTMPHAPDDSAGSALAERLALADGVTKYLTESRTKIEVKGRDGAPRGGWDKLKPAGDVDAELAAGHYMDLVRWLGGSDKLENGHVLEQRVMSGGEGATASGALADGTWTVVIERNFAGEKPGDVTLAADQLYNISFALHDDFSNARFHHVSLGYRLGFDDDSAEINAVKQ
jgi:cytochrome c-type protein NapC